MRFEGRGDDVWLVDRFAFDPEGAVERFEGAGEFLRVGFADGAEGAASVDGGLWEGLWCGARDGKVEIAGPALAFLFDPLVFVCGGMMPSVSRVDCKVEWGGFRHSLLISIGAVLPHAFMTPPRRIGTYVTSQCLKAGEFWVYRLSSQHWNKKPAVDKRGLLWLLILSKPSVARQCIARTCMTCNEPNNVSGERSRMQLTLVTQNAIYANGLTTSRYSVSRGRPPPSRLEETAGPTPDIFFDRGFQLAEIKTCSHVCPPRCVI